MLLRRCGDDAFELQVSAGEAALFSQLCNDLRDQLTGTPDAPHLRRLSPTAHPGHPDRERAYQEMVGGDLVDGQVAALDTVVRTLEQDRLTTAELDAWLRALNALRLALGTALDVSEDRLDDEVAEEDPAFYDHLLYDDLSAVVGLIVSLLADR